MGKKKHRERYYLLPGMGSGSMRRKRKWMLRWSVITGLLASAILVWILYLIRNYSPPE